jgi:hypothetical protein
VDDDRSSFAIPLQRAVSDVFATRLLTDLVNRPIPPKGRTTKLTSALSNAFVLPQVDACF